MLDMKDFRISYRAARVNKGLKQTEACKLIGVSQSTLLNYEHGKTVPDWNTHEKMAEIYGVPKENLEPGTKKF